jgi:sucrose-6-phosphate hydrolase SacC (GH32 family)
MPKLPLRITAIALFLLCLTHAPAAQTKSPKPTGSYWLFAGFKANSEDGVFYALSSDGYHWTLANQGKPVLHQTEPNELMRDPFVQRGPDGTFQMVWTWSWRTPTVIGHSTSTDLVHWTPHQHLAVMANEPAALNVWAPALYYDLAQHRWLIFWSSTIPGRFPGDDSGDNRLNHRIFSTTTKDFSTFTPAKVFFDPGYSVIDATLIHAANKYHLVFKDERKTPLQKHLLTAESSTIEGPWTNISEPFSETWSEGAAIIPVKGGYIAYYDHYRDPQHYAATFSPDLKHWTDATPQTTFPSGLRHGSFLQLTKAEYDRLAALKP